MSQRYAGSGLRSCLAAALLVLACAPTLRADEACDGVRLPPKAEVFGKQLVLNGTGIRRATVFNVHVYVAGLYLEHRTNSSAVALTAADTKRITLHFVRDVSSEDMAKAIRDGLEENAGPELAHAQKLMRSFEGFLPELKKGTVLTFAFGPGQGLQVQSNGKLLGTVKDDRFANMIFKIWLGDHPPDKGLKKSLLGAGC